MYSDNLQCTMNKWWPISWVWCGLGEIAPNLLVKSCTNVCISQTKLRHSTGFTKVLEIRFSSYLHTLC